MNILPAQILFLLLSHQIVSSSMRREFVVFAAYRAPSHVLFAFVSIQYTLDWETLIFKIWVLEKHLFLLSCNNTQWKEPSTSTSDPYTRVYTNTHTHGHFQHFFFFLPRIPSSAQGLCLADWIPQDPFPVVLTLLSLHSLQWARKAGPVLFLWVVVLVHAAAWFLLQPLCVPLSLEYTGLRV